MPSGPRYFLLENNAVTGPHSFAVLKQKAEIHVITPETPIAPEGETTWTPLREMEVLHAELFPERPHYALGPKVIEQVNTPSEPHHAPSVEKMLRANTARQRAAEGDLLRELPPRPNNRRRDYLVLAGFINGLVAVNLLLGRPWYDPFLLGFFAMGNIAIAWVLFVVMDRY